MSGFAEKDFIQKFLDVNSFFQIHLSVSLYKSPETENSVQESEWRKSRIGSNITV